MTSTDPVSDPTGATPEPAGTRISIQQQVGAIAGGGKVVGVEVHDSTFIIEADQDPAPPGPKDPPYKGLDSYDVDDAPLFFGREKLTAELVAFVREHSFLAIVGASGSGKSSLARAGLIAALLDKNPRPLKGNVQPPLGSRDWRYVAVTPTAQPFEALARGLVGNGAEAATLLKALTADPLALRQQAASSRHLLLLVDQFEELFTPSTDEKQRTDYVKALLAACDAPNFNRATASCTVILTVRADFYHRCIDFENLRAALDKHQKNIGAMDPAELRRTIERPAAENNWVFQQGLVEQILDDVGDQPGNLPLLSYALQETWKKRSGRVMTLAGYLKAGGVKQAISQTADSVFADLTRQGLGDAARRVLLDLVEPADEDRATRRREQRSKLEEDPRKKEALWALSAPNARLVIMDKETVQISHEALITAWPQLGGWLKTYRADLQLLERIRDAATIWAAAPEAEKESLLAHRGGQLDDALKLRDDDEYTLADPAPAYLAACVALRDREREAERKRQEERIRAAEELAQEQQRRAAAEQQRAEAETQRAAEQTTAATRLRLRNRVLRVVGVTALVAAILAGVFGVQAQKSERAAVAERFTAQVASTRAISSEGTAVAERAISVSYAATAQAASTRAVEQQKIAEVGRAEAERQARLADSRALSLGAAANLERDPELSILLASRALTVDPNSSGAEDALRQALIASRVVERRDLQLSSSLRQVGLSPDGTRFAVAGKDGMIQVGETVGNRPTKRFAFDSGRWIVSLRLSSRDGRLLATSSTRLDSSDSRVIVWDTDSEQERMIVAYKYRAEDIAFTPADDVLAVAGGDKVCLWQIATKSELRCAKLPGASRLQFSSHGEYLIVSQPENKISLWDGAFTHALYEWTALDPKEFIYDIAFSAKADRIAVAGSRTITTWYLTGTLPISPTIATAPLVQGSVVNSIAFSADDRCLASVSDDHTAVIWGEHSDRVLTLRGHSDSAYLVAFLADTDPSENKAVEPCGRRLVTLDGAGTLRQWNIGATQEYQTLVPHRAPIEEIEFSPAGDYLATAGDDGTVQVWTIPPFQLAPPVLQYRGALTHTDRIDDIDISPDGKLLATASFDGTATIWDVPSLRRLHSLKSQSGKALFAVAFRPPDAQQVATGEQDGRVILWRTETGTLLEELLPPNGGAVRSIAFNRDGSQLVIAADYGRSILLDLVSKQARALDNLAAGTSYDAIFEPTGARVFIGMNSGQIMTWPTQTTAPATLFAKLDKPVYTLAFSADTKFVAAGGAKGQLVIWDIAAQQTRMTLTGSAGSSVNSVRFSPDNRLLAAADEDGTIRFYLTNREDLLDYAVNVRTTRTLTFDECRSYSDSNRCTKLRP